MSLLTSALVSGISRVFSLPRLSAPLIVTLGLTLGAVLSVIAISSALLYKPLQGIKNETKIESFEYRLNISEALSISYWNMRRLSAFNESFKDLGVWGGISSLEQQVMVDNVIHLTTMHQASNSILQVLGTQLLKGQDVTIDKPEDYIWISNSFWQQVFDQQDNALGKQITISGKSYIIAGVIEDLMGIETSATVLPQQVWLITDLKALIGTPELTSISNELDSILVRRNHSSAQLPTKAEAQQWVKQFIIDNVDQSQAEGYLNFVTNTPVEIISSDYRSKILGDTFNLLVALFIAVVGLLLMASLNLLNLFIAHYQGRTKEFAVQITLGASLSRVRLLVFLENLASFILAAIAGLLVTGWLIKMLPTLAGDNLPLIESISIDATTIMSSFAIILALNGLFSSLALVDINKQALVNNLNSSGKGLQAQSNQWLSRSLMVVQLSIASILLTASVMLAIQSYHAVYKDLGYELGNSYLVSSYNTDEAWADQLADFDNYQISELKQLHQGLNNIVETNVSNSRVVINSYAPLSDNFQANVYFPDDAPDQRLIYISRYLSADYFESFNIPMLAGANLSQQQIENNEARIVIDQVMANMLFPDLENVDIIGKSVQLRQSSADEEEPPYIINGIVPSIQSQAGNIENNNMPAVYFPNINSGRSINFTVMMPPGETLTADMIEDEISQQFPRLDNLQVRSLETLWQQQTLTQRISLWVILTMTGLTLLLAAIGVAGLTQMTTNHRKYELAVRMATGAKQMRLINFILKDAVAMLVIGLGLGFAVSVLGYQQIQQQLAMLPDFDWLAMILLDSGLIAIVLLSVFTPAWRVISADPMQALRQE